MVATPKFSINMMAENVLQKEVLFNEAVLTIESVLAGTAIALTNTPPGSPANGDTYMIDSAGTGLWSGHNNKLTFYYNGWHFLTVPTGLTMYNQTDSSYYSKSVTVWNLEAGISNSLAALTDVTLTAPATGSALVYNGSEWVDGTPASTLDALSDVNVSGATTGQLLSFNGTDWVPTAPGAYDDATAAEYWSNSGTDKVVEVATVWLAAAVVTLTDGATITPNFGAGINFGVILAGNRDLANPTNVNPGQSGMIIIRQDGTGGRTLTYGTNWKFAGGTDPTLSTGPNAIDVLSYFAVTATEIVASVTLDYS